jgi:hypothetical protein
MTDDTRTHLDRALDVLVYAPLGAGLLLLDAAPTLVETCTARGKAELGRRQEQVVHQAMSARTMGQFAWTYGLPKLRNRARQRLTNLGNVAGQLLRTAGVLHPPSPARAPISPASPTRAAPPVPTPEPPVVHRRSESATTATGNGAHATAATATGSGPTSSELPIPGYDALSASQVVERLAGLADEELEAVRAYEASHRNRRTILGKIEQLESPSV